MSKKSKNNDFKIRTNTIFIFFWTFQDKWLVINDEFKQFQYKKVHEVVKKIQEGSLIMNVI